MHTVLAFTIYVCASASVRMDCVGGGASKTSLPKFKYIRHTRTYITESNVKFFDL